MDRPLRYLKFGSSESYQQAFDFIKLAQEIGMVPYAHKRVEDWPRSVKWPIPDADRIYRKLTEFRGRFRPAGCQVVEGKVVVMPLNTEQTAVVRVINEALRKWAKAHAPPGFGWTCLDVSYHTDGEYVEDIEARGPSIYGELGEHMSG